MWLLVALSLLIPSSPGETSSFAGVDSDGDGMIEPEEIQELGAALGVRRGDRHDARPMRMRADADASGAVSPAELRRWMDRIEARWSTREVADWISLALLLPQYAASFRENSIAGDDLRELSIDPDGDKILREDLQIASMLHRKKIKRAISTLFYSLGTVPPAPDAQPLRCLPATCGSVGVGWREPSASDGRRAHAYRLQWTAVSAAPAGTVVRSSAAAAAQAAALEHDAEALPWRSAESHLVEECRDCAHHISLSANDVAHSGATEGIVNDVLVRVQAWNAFGHGPYSRFVRCAAPTPCAPPIPGAVPMERLGGDADGDGKLHAGELHALAGSLAPNATKEEHRQRTAAAMVRLDVDNDGFVSSSELKKRWLEKKRHSTPSDVVDWLEHAVLLPQHAPRFRAHAIDHFALLALLSDSSPLKDPDELNVASQLDRDRIKRAIKANYADVDREPYAPSALAVARAADCREDRIVVKWNAPAVKGASGSALPVHGYRLKQRIVRRPPVAVAAAEKAGSARDNGQRVPVNGENRSASSNVKNSDDVVEDDDDDDDDVAEWLYSQRIVGRTALVTVPEDVRALGGSMRLRVQAWNMLGCSSWSTVAVYEIAATATATSSTPSGASASASSDSDSDSGECVDPNASIATLLTSAELEELPFAEFHSRTAGATTTRLPLSSADGEAADGAGASTSSSSWWSSSWLVLSFVLNNIMPLGSIVFAIITTAVSYQRKYAKDAKDAKVDAAKKTRGGVDDAAKGGATKVADGGAGTKVQDKADATKMKTAKVEAAAATKTKTEKEAPRKTKRVNECVVCGCDGHAHMHNCAECGSQFCRDKCGDSTLVAFGYQKGVCRNCAPNKAHEVQHLVIYKVSGPHDQRLPKAPPTRIQLRTSELSYSAGIHCDAVSDTSAAKAGEYVLRLERKESKCSKTLHKNVSAGQIIKKNGVAVDHTPTGKRKLELQEHVDFVEFAVKGDKGSEHAIHKHGKVVRHTQIGGEDAYDIEEYVEVEMEPLLLITKDIEVRNEWLHKLNRALGTSVKVDGGDGDEGSAAAAAAAAAAVPSASSSSSSSLSGDEGERAAAVGSSVASSSSEPGEGGMSLRVITTQLPQDGAYFQKKKKGLFGIREWRYIYIKRAAISTKARRRSSISAIAPAAIARAASASLRALSDPSRR